MPIRKTSETLARRRRRDLVVGGAGTAAVAVVLFGVLSLTGGDDPTPSVATATDAVPSLDVTVSASPSPTSAEAAVLPGEPSPVEATPSPPASATPVIPADVQMGDEVTDPILGTVRTVSGEVHDPRGPAEITFRSGEGILSVSAIATAVAVVSIGDEQVTVPADGPAQFNIGVSGPTVTIAVAGDQPFAFTLEVQYPTP